MKPNYNQIVYSALRGYEELFNEGEFLNDSGYFKDQNGFLLDPWQGDEISEALYAFDMRWS